MNGALPKLFGRHTPREDLESFLSRVDNAARLSEQSGAKGRFLNAVESGAFYRRRVVMVGDEYIRQAFISLGCLAGDTVDAAVAPWRTEKDNSEERPGKRIDGRFRLDLKTEKGEVFYSPLAGGLLRYDWGEDVAPLVQEETVEPWLEACRAVKSFRMVTYAYEGYTIEIALSEADTVFLNAGTQSTRKESQKMIISLLECMETGRETARQEGWDPPLWSKIHYIMTGLGHSTSKNGMCTAENLDISYQQWDIELINSDREKIVAAHIDLRRMGEFHVGGPQADCNGWLQPGVPDLVAAEVADTVMVDWSDFQQQQQQLLDQEISQQREPQKEPISQQEGPGQEDPQNAPEPQQVLPQVAPSQPLLRPEEAEVAPQAAATGSDNDNVQNSSPTDLTASCPFPPSNNDGTSNKDGTSFPSITPDIVPLTQMAYEDGFVNFLASLISEPTAEIMPSVLELNAKAGQLQQALSAKNANFEYRGFDSAGNVMDLVGNTVTLGDGYVVTVPLICWANTFVPIYVQKADVVVSLITSPQDGITPESQQSMIDNLVR